MERKMKNLLEALNAEREAYVKEHREAPVIHLTKTKGEGLTGRLTDVGSDFIELSGFYMGSPVVKIARSQIADVEVIKKGRGK
jgi:hypothetical protein